MSQLEGNGFSLMAQLFVKDQSIVPTTLTTATVNTPPPGMSVQVDGDTFVTPAEGVVVAEHLTEHKRTISYKGGKVSGHVDGYHGPGNLTSLEITRGELTIHTDVKKGDKVIVAIANDGQLVYVLDKIGD